MVSARWKPAELAHKPEQKRPLGCPAFLGACQRHLRHRRCLNNRVLHTSVSARPWPWPSETLLNRASCRIQEIEQRKSFSLEFQGQRLKSIGDLSTGRDKELSMSGTH